MTESSCFSCRKSKWNLTKSNTVPLNSAVQDSVSHKVQTEGQTKLFLAGKEDQSGNRGSSCSRKNNLQKSVPQKLMKQRFYFGAHHTGNCIDKVIVQESDVYILILSMRFRIWDFSH